MIQYCHMRFLRLSVASFCLFAASAESSTMLTNCADVTALPVDESVEPPAARLEGQLIAARYCKKPPHPNCEAYYILSDKSDNITLRASSKTLYKVGDLVRVIGYRSIINRTGCTIVGTNVMVLGHAEIPPPARVRIDEIKNGKMHLHYVSVSGTVVDAFCDEFDPRFHWLVISQNGQTLPVVTESDSASEGELAELIGQNITVAGHYHRPIRPNGHYISSTRIETGNSARSGETSDDNPFEAPNLDSDAPFTPLRRSCVTGRVLAVSGDRQVIVLPANGTPINIRLRWKVSPPPVDAHVQFSGFAELGKFKSGLIQAIWKPEPGEPPALQQPLVITPSEILVDPDGTRHVKSAFHGRLVRLSGTLTGVLSDMSGRLLTHLNANGFIVPVEVPRTSTPLKPIEPGSTVALCGICQIEFDPQSQQFGVPRVSGFSLILRSDADIAVIKTPPWWTPFKLTIFIGILVLLLLAIVLWNISLRLIAERRGRELFRENVARISADLRTEERTRLAVDLHDSLAQMLTGVSFQIDAGELEIASKSLKSCRDELRNCLWDLRNQTLEQKDMCEAIRRTLKPHVGDAELLIRFNVPRDKLSDLTAHSVLMIVRELVTNAVRHGHAKTVRIAGGLDGDALMLSVRDDGTGFDPDKHPGMAEGHFGLQGIRERVKRCDGTLSIDSAPGKGTKVTVSLKRQK